MTDVRVFPALVDQSLRRARLIAVDGSDSGRVRFEEEAAEEVDCDVLHASANPPELALGDTVLVWCPPTGEREIILGRIGSKHTQGNDGAKTPKNLPQAHPDELVLEAKHSLTLRVGAGSITIREDGKILIKGKDLVSHAQRLNRIKGGAVQIN